MRKLVIIRPDISLSGIYCTSKLTSAVTAGAGREGDIGGSAAAPLHPPPGWPLVTADLRFTPVHQLLENSRFNSVVRRWSKTPVDVRK